MVQEFTSIFHDTVLESNGTTIMDKFNNKFIKGNGVKNSVNLSQTHILEHNYSTNCAYEKCSP